MEFETEMIIKAGLHQAKIAEIPITLWPDGRKSHPPHLKTLRDGWRTLRFYLTYSPRWWVIPGVTVTVLGFQTVLGSFFLSIVDASKHFASHLTRNCRP
jgi:hypothetical protein